ncbi:SusC/RagA family TonB-linked outer membrane protein [Dyadobacter sediminis]|uniref:TonB-dependent receptor n=1 Tax=Dyadobacter sediminis TaxID=1493691 RepID=A0A5R9K8X4_9BACT|nr:TonB-dependent receptor [Dyadobacter sediminis]TLU90522.1 TonB-dependent receptor [Dyadobacter sediminis]GGC08404.1 SusC/RagA family TonB-linked outer membrane protein [Dyadobacter sediminis]
MKTTVRILYTLVFLFCSIISFAQGINVTGKVTSGSDGSALPGASVLIKGTTTGVPTDIDGNYTIQVPSSESVLVFSMIGMVAQEIPVGTQTVINAALAEDAKSLNEVVVVGYGTQRKLDVTGSVAQIKGEEISRQPSMNAVSGLQGKVAGVQINNSGKPGEAPQIRIRGVGTAYGSANPLYVVDGVWFDDISFLNSADIESMNILKDASSQSIYGVRAANGVVLITTKRGKSGKAVVDYNGFVGFQKVTNQIKMANGREYATMVNELSNINGKQNILDPSQYGEGTDWYDQILRTAKVNNHQLSISGGGEKSTYNLSLGFLNQEGVVQKNNFKRYTARLQNDFQVLKSLKVGYTATGSYSKSQDEAGGIFRQLYAAGPIVPVYNADGSYGDPNDFGLGDANNFNPQVTIDFFNQNTKRTLLTANAYAELNVLDGLTFRTSLGGRYSQDETRSYTPQYAATLKQQNTTSVLQFVRPQTRYWIFENTLTYTKEFGNHNFTALIGQSAQRDQSYQLTASALNVPYSSEGDLYLTLGNADSRYVTDQGDLGTYASYFGRVNYSFADRYLLNASLRADGSSKFFQGGNAWGYFPSVGAGWVISNEPFMESQKFFDNLKIRGSWGKIGNASVPSNLSTLTVATGGGLAAVFGGQLNTGASINTIIPPTTYWERGVGTDIGLEAAVLNSRLSLELDYYSKKTERAIFDIPVLTSIGTETGRIVGNQANFRNKGFEAALTWRDEIGKDLTYSIGLNGSINDNTVLSVSSGSNPIYDGGVGLTSGALATRTVVGDPIGSFYGLIVDGIFQNADEISKSAQPNAKPGDFRYRDISGTNGTPDGAITGLDRQVIGNPNPKYTYGINTSWNYKTIDLTLDFQGVAKVDIYNANMGWRYGNENFTKDFFDNRWHGEGTSNTYPSANIGGGANYLPNTFFVQSGSYFRVRNAQLGYTFPQSVNEKLKIRKLRLYANAQNALNFFKYKGLSPEVRANENKPTQAGIDANVYPISATYNFGINVTF